MERNFIITAVVCLGLAGCGPSASQSVASNRIVTDVDAAGTTVLGRYDPSGFSMAEVRKIVAKEVCRTPVLASFNETGADGQIRFTATCAGGTRFGGNSGANFTRTGPNSATKSVVYSSNGALVSASGTTTF